LIRENKQKDNIETFPRWFDQRWSCKERTQTWMKKPGCRVTEPQTLPVKAVQHLWQQCIVLRCLSVSVVCLNPLTPGRTWRSCGFLLRSL